MNIILFFKKKYVFSLKKRQVGGGKTPDIQTIAIK